MKLSDRNLEWNDGMGRRNSAMDVDVTNFCYEISDN